MYWFSCVAALSRFFYWQLFDFIFQNLFTDFLQIVGAYTQGNVGFIMMKTSVGTTTQSSMFQFINVGFYCRMPVFQSLE